MPASLEAAHQADWARAHLSEVDVSGPLSFDLALSATSVELKGLVGDDVAGRANCFLLPEIVAGNILYKAFVYLGRRLRSRDCSWRGCACSFDQPCRPCCCPPCLCRSGRCSVLVLTFHPSAGRIIKWL